MLCQKNKNSFGISNTHQARLSINQIESEIFRNMTITTRQIDGISFSFLNEKEFAAIYHDIFEVEDWRFVANTLSPFILDCGAHIGVSVLYFKKLYPRAKVVAFEPDPETFKLLELNVGQNKLSDVELVNAALSNCLGEIDFYSCKDSWFGQMVTRF